MFNMINNAELYTKAEGDIQAEASIPPKSIMRFIYFPLYPQNL